MFPGNDPSPGRRRGLGPCRAGIPTSVPREEEREPLRLSRPTQGGGRAAAILCEAAAASGRRRDAAAPSYRSLREEEERPNSSNLAKRRHQGGGEMSPPCCWEPQWEEKGTLLCPTAPQGGGRSTSETNYFAPFAALRAISPISVRWIPRSARSRSLRQESSDTVVRNTWYFV